MNENTLILTEHRLLPRLFDAALTLVAWGGFLFFLYARLYLLFAALNGWLLILWYQYNRRRAHARRRQPGYFHQEELARSFNVSPQIISEMSQYNLLTVYHDQIGRIIDLKINGQEEEEQ